MALAFVAGSNANTCLMPYGTPHEFFKLGLCYIDQYNLGAVNCRNSLSKGGVCIFVHNSLNYSNINLDSFCIDQIIEICAVKLLTAGRNICTVAFLEIFFTVFKYLG
jgi:hypothetical protein